MGTDDTDPLHPISDQLFNTAVLLAKAHQSYGIVLWTAEDDFQTMYGCTGKRKDDKTVTVTVRRVGRGHLSP